MNIASLCSREVVGIAAEASVREAATLACEEPVHPAFGTAMQ